MLNCLLAFIIGLITDFVWAKWTQAANEHKPFAAANWSFGTHVLSLIFVIIVVNNDYLQIISYLVGCYLGCYFAVRKDENGT